MTALNLWNGPMVCWPLYDLKLYTFNYKRRKQIKLGLEFCELCGQLALPINSATARDAPQFALCGLIVASLPLFSSRVARCNLILLAGRYKNVFPPFLFIWRQVRNCFSSSNFEIFLTNYLKKHFRESLGCLLLLGCLLAVW
jgi:hypothetical protein